MNQVTDNYRYVGGEEKVKCTCHDGKEYWVGMFEKGEFVNQWACHNAASVDTANKMTPGNTRYVKCRIPGEFLHDYPALMTGKIREYKIMNGFYPTYLIKQYESVRVGAKYVKQLKHYGSGYLLHNAFKIEKRNNRENSDIVSYIRFNETTSLYYDFRWPH